MKNEEGLFFPWYCLVDDGVYTLLSYGRCWVLAIVCFASVCFVLIMWWVDLNLTIIWKCVSNHLLKSGLACRIFLCSDNLQRQR